MEILWSQPTLKIQGELKLAWPESFPSSPRSLTVMESRLITSLFNQARCGHLYFEGPLITCLGGIGKEGTDAFISGCKDTLSFFHSPSSSLCRSASLILSLSHSTLSSFSSCLFLVFSLSLSSLSNLSATPMPLSQRYYSPKTPATGTFLIIPEQFTGTLAQLSSTPETPVHKSNNPLFSQDRVLILRQG